MPPKVCFFAWEVWWGKVLTMEQLKNGVFRWLAGVCCVEERKKTWITSYCIIFIPGLSWACLLSAKELLEGWSRSTSRKKTKKLWMAAPLYLFWAIWRERNRIVFDNVDFSLFILKSSFISMFVYWAKCLDLGECRLVRILLCIL